MVSSPGAAATGGGWYTLSGSGRVNFGFTVRKVDSTCASNCAYKGQLGLRLFQSVAVGHTETQNACGASVSPVLATGVGL
jgi:hypothetical protein